MPVPKRGDIWWADLGTLNGVRPGILLTSDRLLPHLTNVTCVVITSRIRGIDTEVPLSREEHGLPRDSVANCNNVMTIPRDHLIERISHADQDTMNAVVEAVHVALALEW